MENKSKIKSLVKKLIKFGFSVKLKTSGQKDPVCGMQATDAITYAYKSQAYFFCSDHCREQFEKEPERYIPK